MSALEVIALVRLSKSKQELPILFISKNSDDKEIYNHVLNGANDYFVQSSNFNPILERTHKYFQIFKSIAA